MYVTDNDNLIDIWRHKHPSHKMYTWSNKDKSLQSRIDFWLISTDNVERTDIEPTIFTDHKAISIRINLSERPKVNSDYWKLNKTLIQNHDFQNQIIKLIEKYWRQATCMESPGSY